MIEQPPHAVAGLAMGGVLVFLLVAHVVLFLAALVSVLGSPRSGGMKLVWCVVVFVAPFLGPLAWFVIGRSTARRAYQPGSY